MKVSAERYSRVAVVLHWLIALAIFAMLGMGYVMTDMIHLDAVDMTLKFKLFQWHKSLGIVILWLVAFRLAWRLTHKAPELGANFARWERYAAAFGHFCLYLLMIAMPVTGWLIVSSSPTGIPTFIFGLFQWPHIPGITPDEAANHVYKERHWLLAYVLLGMLALHIGAVVKHLVIDRENILPRMWFGPRTAPQKNPEKI